MSMTYRLHRAALAAASMLAAAGLGGCDQSPQAAPVAQRIHVRGMHCEGCEKAICDKVLKIEGVASCEASHVEESVEVLAPMSKRTEIEVAIARLGYTIRTGDPTNAPSHRAPNPEAPNPEAPNPEAPNPEAPSKETPSDRAPSESESR